MVTLSAGAVARQLGVSPATLRTWAHRYGIEPSARSEGSHRRYTPDDVDRLVQMQRLVRSGVPVADAAAQVREGVVPTAPTPMEKPSRASGRSGAKSLWEAAMALDGQRCSSLIASVTHELGVIPTWEEVIAPVLRKAGDQWATDSSGIDVEHVLSDAVVSGLIRTEPVRREGVLLATTAEEEHVLPLHALRAALAEQGIGCELLTARMPAAALGDAVRRLRPGVVILWSQVMTTADAEGFAGLPAIRPRPALAVAGPGWSSDTMPSGVPLLGSLTDAVNFVRSHV